MLALRRKFNSRLTEDSDENNDDGRSDAHGCDWNGAFLKEQRSIGR
jgi:hypothetical protein